MIQPLKKLAAQLTSLDLYKESFVVEALINRAEKRTKLFSDPSYQKNIQSLLKSLGLSSVYNIEDAVELLCAAGYLKEGITDNNLLLAGLSIASLIPTLQELKKIIGTDISSDSSLILPAAQLINKNQGLIKSSLDKFKNPKLIPYIKHYIPDGDLLTQYADRIWEALRVWALKAIKTPPPTEDAPTEIEDTTDLEGQVDQLLADFNSQL